MSKGDQCNNRYSNVCSRPCYTDPLQGSETRELLRRVNGLETELNGKISAINLLQKIRKAQETHIFRQRQMIEDLERSNELLQLALSRSNLQGKKSSPIVPEDTVVSRWHKPQALSSGYRAKQIRKGSSRPTLQFSVK